MLELAFIFLLFFSLVLKRNNLSGYTLTTDPICAQHATPYSSDRKEGKFKNNKVQSF